MPEVTYNGNKYSSESEIGKRALAFEQPGYRPEQHPYPRMLYKAQKCSDGVVRADSGASAPRHMFASDEAYRFAIQRDEAFNAQCRTIVGEGVSRGEAEAQHKRAIENGWRDSAEDAIALCRQYELDIKGAAAMKRIVADSRMSEKAQAEALRIQSASPDILPEIPEAPRVKKEHWKTRQARENKASAA